MTGRPNPVHYQRPPPPAGDQRWAPGQGRTVRAHHFTAIDASPPPCGRRRPRRSPAHGSPCSPRGVFAPRPVVVTGTAAEPAGVRRLGSADAVRFTRCAACRVDGPDPWTVTAERLPPSHPSRLTANDRQYRRGAHPRCRCRGRAARRPVLASAFDGAERQIRRLEGPPTGTVRRDRRQRLPGDGLRGGVWFVAAVLLLVGLFAVAVWAVRRWPVGPFAAATSSHRPPPVTSASGRCADERHRADPMSRREPRRLPSATACGTRVYVGETAMTSNRATMAPNGSPAPSTREVPMSRFLAALLVVLTASACTPAMQDAWRTMSPAERDAYMHYVNGGSVDCYQALDRHWSASSRQWARSIVARESGNIPTAANLTARLRLLAASLQPALRVASQARLLAVAVG